MADINREEIYQLAVEMMNDSDNTEVALLKTAEAFETLGDYKDSKGLALKCIEKADEAAKNQVYKTALEKMQGDVISDYEEAIEIFGQISEWKDTPDKIALCRSKIETLKAKEEQQRIYTEQLLKQKKKKRNKLIIIAASVVAVFVILIIVIMTVIVPNHIYNKAVDLIKQENYIEAYESLKQVDKYKDSQELMQSIESEYLSEKVNSLAPNDTFTLGSYDNHEIEWIVMSKTNNGVLLLCKNSITNKAYNDEYKAVTWKNCTLRNWLNSDFYNGAFSEHEKKFIKKTFVQTNISCFGYSNSVETSEDYVFILSKDEFDKYNSDVTVGWTCYDFNGNKVGWWVRTYDDRGSLWSDEVFDVYGFDENGYSYHTVHNDEFTVRPAMWLSAS